jgi:hypothetical protein
MTLNGPRQVHVPPERLAGWLDGFAQRHGTPIVAVTEGAVALRSPDQATAIIGLVWGPLPPSDDPLNELVAAYTENRLVGALIVRRRRHAVGVFEGPRLVTGRHHGHYVQGKTKAGGWSQQRYARRRANQADHAYASAIDDAIELLLPAVGLRALAVGGDQAGVETVLADRRLASLKELPRLKVPGVPDPNAAVLADFGGRYRLAPISLNEYA